MNKIVLFIMLISMTLIGSYAGLCLKRASSALEKSFLSILRNKDLYLGGFLYVLSAGINIFLLKHMDYSVVLPLTSITYVWTMFFSAYILKEKITYKKIAGVMMIVIGAIIIVL